MCMYGPSLYVVEASDLNTVTPGNLLCKYADDTYIIIPASNSHTRNFTKLYDSNFLVRLLYKQVY